MLDYGSIVKSDTFAHEVAVKTSANKPVRLLVLALTTSSILCLSGVASAREMKETVYDLVSKAQYKPAWNTLFVGSKNLPGWIKKGEGVSSPCEEIKAAGGTYIVGWMCEPHNCGNHQFAVAFSKDLKKAWGMRYVLEDVPAGKQAPATKTTWFGNPSPEIKKLLEQKLSQ